jgi:hypothetical protein
MFGAGMRAKAEAAIKNLAAKLLGMERGRLSDRFHPLGRARYTTAWSLPRLDPRTDNDLRCS